MVLRERERERKKLSTLQQIVRSQKSLDAPLESAILGPGGGERKSDRNQSHLYELGHTNTHAHTHTTNTNKSGGARLRIVSGLAKSTGSPCPGWHTNLARQTAFSLSLTLSPSASLASVRLVAFE